MKKSSNYRAFNLRTILFFIVLSVCVQAAAQDKNTAKFKKIVIGTINFIDYVLNSVDTVFVEDNIYNMTFMPEYSYNYEYYHFRTLSDKPQSINIAPEGRNILKFNLGWRRLIVGYSIDLQDSRKLTEFNTSLYSTRFALDLYYRKSNEGYNVKSLTGFYNNGEPLEEHGSYSNIMTIKQIGIGLYYAFNKRFSYAAAYGPSTIQLKSAGSFVLGGGYNQQEFTMNHEHFDPIVRGQLKDELGFKKARYDDFNISFGYAYNWAFAKNFLAGISLAPAISYKKCNMEFDDRNSLQADINLDFTTRAALVYNNNIYYVGASLESHTFCYRRNRLSITNGLGVLELCVGFNFWKKKKHTGF